LAPAAAVRAENVKSLGEKGSGFDIVVGDRREHATLPLVGNHNVYNALAATAIAQERGMTLSEVISSLASLAPADKRGQVVRIGNITVINDCYNSNPKALAAMVDTLATMPARRRIVVAGEMLELGPQGETMHRESGQHIAAKRIDVLIGVRGLASHMVEAAKQAGVIAEFVTSPEEAGKWLTTETREGDVVLLKASRGVKLEKALEQLLAIQPSGQSSPTTDNTRLTTNDGD
jgi:UDP-N-acetylmuramoyl-tripeptide--D-alanyl-D-alanine ligase